MIRHCPSGGPDFARLGERGNRLRGLRRPRGSGRGRIAGPVAAVVGGLVGSVMGAAAGGILDEQHGRAAVGDSEAPPEDIDAEEILVESDPKEEDEDEETHLQLDRRKR